MPFLPFLVKFILGRVLTHPELKAKVFGELKKKAADSTTTIDDDAVKVVEEVWDVVVPVVTGRIK